ncbi:MAG TPA: glucose-6-phosphate isomerase [Gemmatimonadaceae bacterium]|nr:glucose-6-phosphate isomerase [Gemmatimonadaceae bacterium]
MTIRLDFSNMMAAAVGGGISEEMWEGAAERFREARATVAAQRAGGVLGFLDLPGDVALHDAVRRFAARAEGRYADVVVLGIGGSALGPIALRTALCAPGWNALPDAARGGRPRLHVLDNVDPRTIGALLQQLELRRTLFVVTSKSGGTAETMAQFLVVAGRLHEAGLAPRDHLVFVTDPEKGALRALARQEGIPALDIPPNVGGRFSVLTPVGLLPAALLGLDTAALLAGAGDMRDRCAGDDLAGNPAGAYAVLQWLADEELGKGIHVFMPYSDALRDMAAWFVQLWAESLGKVGGEGEGVGPTPIAALGATDQHSQVQLFMEGPANKTVTLVAVAEPAHDVEIPRLHGDVKELAYLGGHSLFELLDVERRATAGALARRGRPNLTLTLDRVDAWHLGALFMFLEIATIHAGALYGVDPLNQPGVELGKQFTYAMLGRGDATAARAEWEKLPHPDPRWQL